MRIAGLILFVTLMIAATGSARGMEPSEEPLPSEKARVVYETLLPSEDGATVPDSSREEMRPAEPESGALKMPVMTAGKVEQILSEDGISLSGSPGRREFFLDGIQVFMLVDSEHNRFRLLSSLTRLDLLRNDVNFNEVELLQQLLKANYLATGDIRFCLNNHVVWASFVHPLDTLTRRDLLDALDQIADVVRKTKKGSG